MEINPAPLRFPRAWQADPDLRQLGLELTNFFRQLIAATEEFDNSQSQIDMIVSTVVTSQIASIQSRLDSMEQSIPDSPSMAFIEDLIKRVEDLEQQVVY